MHLDRYADRLRSQLAAVADAGHEDARAIAERMSVVMEPAIRLTLLELLAEATADISRELAPGSVDVRLRGHDPELIVTRPPEAFAAPAIPSAPASAEPAPDDESATFRTTLRLPERLKSRVEQAAAAEGVSVNSWLVRAVITALEPDPRRPVPRTGDRFTGWVR